MRRCEVEAWLGLMSGHLLVSVHSGEIWSWLRDMFARIALQPQHSWGQMICMYCKLICSRGVMGFHDLFQLIESNFTWLDAPEWRSWVLQRPFSFRISLFTLIRERSVWPIWKQTFTQIHARVLFLFLMPNSGQVLRRRVSIMRACVCFEASLLWCAAYLRWKCAF